MIRDFYHKNSKLGKFYALHLTDLYLCKRRHGHSPLYGFIRIKVVKFYAERRI
jgi:hypothetical protein